MKSLFSFARKVKGELLIQKMGFILTFYLLCLLPAALLILSIKRKKEQLELAKEEVSYLPMRIEQAKELQKDRHVFFEKYQDADPYFVDRMLEPLLFLHSEIEALGLVVSNPAFESCTPFKKRLETLTNGNNRLIFSEGKRQVQGKIEEVELIQNRPVEVSVDDLKKILSILEEIPIKGELSLEKRPQFIVRRFHLNKKKLAERETYQLEMQLIKRGVLK